MDGQDAPTIRTAAAGAGLRPKRGIASRLRWSYLITSTLPLMLVGALLIAVLFGVQQRNAYASQQAVADQISSSIAAFLVDVQQQLSRSSRELQPDASAEELQTQALRVVNSSPDLRTLTVVDAQGRVLAMVANSVLTEQQVEPIGLDPAMVGAATSIGQGARSAILLGADGQQMFQLVLPVRDPATFRISGALGAEVSIARVQQILRLGAKDAPTSVYLLDAERRLLMSSGGADWRPPDDLGPLYVPGQTVAEYAGGDGRQVVGARSPVPPLSEASWSVVVERNSSEFYTEVYRSILLLVALVALVAVGSTIGALYQARRLVDPISELSNGARQLAAGQLTHRISVDTGDELGELATTFNEMAERLQGSLQEIERQNERLRHGLVLARDIQQGLLPAAPPWHNEMLSVEGRSLPASEVGGDFYTYMALPDGRAAVAIGDISGKGVAAALLMALTSSTLESQAHFFDHPAEMLRALHEALRSRLQANQMNAALLIAVFAADARSVTVANAGMIAPLLIPAAGSSREPGFIEVGGLPIGTALAGRYPEVVIPLNAGDTLLFLSDGIVEAHNRSGEIYGFERLEAFAAELPSDLSVGELVQRAIEAVLRFADGAEPHDDITLIVTRSAASTRLAVAGSGEEQLPVAVRG